MAVYLQPYLQPCNGVSISELWRYFVRGCRWQIKTKTFFAIDCTVCNKGLVTGQLRLGDLPIKAY